MWTCKKCNEEIEDSFDTCWNCFDDTALLEEIDSLEKKEKEIQKESFHQQKSTDDELLRFVFNGFPFDQLRLLRDGLGFKKNDLEQSYLELIKKFTLRFAPMLSIGLLLLFLIDWDAPASSSFANGYLAFAFFISILSIGAAITLFSFLHILLRKLYKISSKKASLYLFFIISIIIAFIYFNHKIQQEKESERAMERFYELFPEERKKQ